MVSAPNDFNQAGPKNDSSSSDSATIGAGGCTGTDCTGCIDVGGGGSFLANGDGPMMLSAGDVWNATGSTGGADAGPDCQNGDTSIGASGCAGAAFQNGERSPIPEDVD